jgi:WhiB family redox-sensing transcriptional regulator
MTTTQGFSPTRLALTGDSQWASRGACRNVDPESLFVIGAAQHSAKIICMSCPVRVDCLAAALDTRTEFGVWGGMTERERRALLRRRPDIRSWRDVLSSSRGVEEYVRPPSRRARQLAKAAD